MRGALVLAFAAFCAAATAEARVLDDLRLPSAWQASASDQVVATLRSDRDGSLCLHADFGRVSGYAVMRRELNVDWPAHFDLGVRIKGGGATNDVQIKFVDDSGENVWWVHRPNAQMPAALTDWRLRRRHVTFAWGPAVERELRRTRFVEFVIAAGRDGGRSSLCLARLSLAERPAAPPTWPLPQIRDSGPSRIWDFQLPREFQGVSLRWPEPGTRRDVDLLASDDGRRWRVLRRIRGGQGPTDALFLPEQEARWLRLRRLRGSGWPQLDLRSASQWPDLNAVLSERALELPRGHLPRAFRSEQNYWALVGVDGGGPRSALLSEDGAIEIGRGGPSVEPVVRIGGARGEAGSLVTWADVQTVHRLPEGFLPQPVVRWEHPALQLEVQAGADGSAQAPTLLARYTLRNPTDRTQTYTLAWVLRPWQVNPPQQFLNTPGGARPLRELEGRSEPGGRFTLLAEGHPLLEPVTAPARWSFLPTDAGLALDALLAAPQRQRLVDPLAQASASLQYEVELPPGASRTLSWTAPLAPTAVRSGSAAAAPSPPRPDSEAAVSARLEAAARIWRERLTRVTFEAGAVRAPAGPADASSSGNGEWVVSSMRVALAHILMSRDAAMLQPGTRSYSRSWIRDGAMMVAGLLRLGERDAARDYVDAFAPHVFASGKVPCCVDARGADPVVENDSHGQFIHAVAEVWRHTGDDAFLRRHAQVVKRVVQWQEALRQSERGQANRSAGRAHLFGLLPPSISHEGYSDKPAYSYWDDFWALRGYRDAVVIAQALGEADLARLWAGWRDEFSRELAASVVATAQHHGISYVAGAADRGDFDATSTTVALNPAQAELPADLLEATFGRYWDEASARAAGRRSWRDYTPYELRVVGAMVRLGYPQRAHALLDFFFADQRPRPWRQWAEVVLPSVREARFLGDMPHAWVASDYIRSAIDLFAWEREADRAVLIGAGWHRSWLDEGISVQGLSTGWGSLSYRVHPRPGGWSLRIQPPTDVQVRLVWPFEEPPPRATLEGQPLTWQGRELPLPQRGGAYQLEWTRP